MNVRCLIATCVNAAGYREAPAADVASGEDGAGWLPFLHGLAAVRSTLPQPAHEGGEISTRGA